MITTKDALEQIVDRTSLRDVVELLAVICEEKADHIVAHWQDQLTAKAWLRSAKALDRSAAKVEV